MTTPPQGQNPFAQTPPPGQPQGGNPYGQTAPMGAAPYPQQPGSPFPGAPVPPPANNKKKIKMILGIVGVVVVGGMMIVGYVAGKDDAKTAKVGDCMHRGNQSDTDPDLEVVDCEGSEAQYKVTARVKGTYLTSIAASEACAKETKDFENFYSERGDGEDFLLCLKKL
ncbi:hypothetical protein HUT18_16875 [Streptomyces sp. NA04227]|uniref:LppU/SCO3897 family protein n=1 Tax=Streptomyces sp. NA04227 TaxID=2742136 RepID=UPI0015910B8D|nr:hypothetical protein [Streptomyces sp. NA04227]QKW07808.1 hypothetical protein HUT18_16875 [Streptomyces sp. NA04227]